MMIILPGAVSILEYEAYADNPAGGDNLWQKLDQNICVEEQIPWHHAGSGLAGMGEDEEEKFQSNKPGNMHFDDWLYNSYLILQFLCQVCHGDTALTDNLRTASYRNMQ